MVTTVAVAGGTGGLGRAVAEAIKRKGNYEVKILGRSAKSELQAETGISTIAVDYSDVAALTKVLVDNKIDTVISTMFVLFDAVPQVNLVKAAESSPYTRRFIPSLWGFPFERKQLEESGVEIGKAKLEAVEALEETSLEYTKFNVGYFLDYWGYPRVKTYQSQIVMVLDIEHRRAAIPGSGKTPVTFTHSLDIAEFVAASLDLPKWERESYVSGDRVTWNEFVQIAEDVTGDKFEVTYDDLDTLLKGRVTELPVHLSLYSEMPKDQVQALFSTFGVWFEKGQFNYRPTTRTLNEIFPNIKARTVREVVTAGWKRV